MIDVIINPTAGNGRAKAAGEQIGQILLQRGIDRRVHISNRPYHATELAKEAAAAGSDTVLSVGGDGTAYEIACGLMNTDTALGIIPAGTGNDFVKALHTPRDPLGALDYILAHPARTIDTGLVNERLFLNCCGVGFDVMVLDYSLKAKKYVKGLLPYLYGVIRTIFTYKPVHVTYTLDSNERVEEDVLLLSVANGQYIGGGIPIAPMAQVDDGLFDVVVVQAIPRRKIPFYLPGLMKGKVAAFSITRHYRCQCVKLAASSGRMNIDGEVIPLEEAAFTVTQAALRIHW